jgi:hypothetical protein
MTLLPPASPKGATWCSLFLEHLEEFAKLAWYLVADSSLVDQTFSRTMVRLDVTPLDASNPQLAYNQAREILISEAIDVLAATRREEEENGNFLPTTLGGLPDLPRLAFMLRLVIHSSEVEVASFLDVTPTSVQELVGRAIERLCADAPLSLLAVCHEAWAS